MRLLGALAAVLGGYVVLVAIHAMTTIAAATGWQL